jgi:hypothetical protein
MRDGELPVSLPTCIGQEMAPRIPHGASAFLVPPILVVYQQLLCHLRVFGNQEGSSQCSTEEGRVPMGIYPAFL